MRPNDWAVRGRRLPMQGLAVLELSSITTLDGLLELGAVTGGLSCKRICFFLFTEGDYLKFAIIEYSLRVVAAAAIFRGFIFTEGVENCNERSSECILSLPCDYFLLILGLTMMKPV